MNNNLILNFKRDGVYKIIIMTIIIYSEKVVFFFGIIVNLYFS